jgi:hypothetical protein
MNVNFARGIQTSPSGVRRIRFALARDLDEIPTTHEPENDI